MIISVYKDGCSIESYLGHLAFLASEMLNSPGQSQQQEEVMHGSWCSANTVSSLSFSDSRLVAGDYQRQLSTFGVSWDLTEAEAVVYRLWGILLSWPNLPCLLPSSHEDALYLVDVPGMGLPVSTSKRQQ